MHATWTGSISFGLVNIPVNLYSASEERELTFHLLHKRDRSPIRFARQCSAEGTEVPYADIVKGYEIKKGRFVVLDEDDFRKANVRKSRTIDIVAFVDQSEIDPMYCERPYYIEPKDSAKAYAILRDALKQTGKVGVGKFVLQHKEHLGIVRPEGDGLVLIQLRFKDEIRRPAGLNLPAKAAAEKEVRVAVSLINRQAERFRPERYHDAFTQELKAVIAKRARGKTVAAKGVEPKATKASDLMAMLERSLRQPPRRHARVR